MDQIKIRGSDRTPEIDFDFGNNVFRISGESYPENVTEFYREPVDKLQAHLLTQSTSDIELVLEFVYFNSSTARILMELLELMDEAASAGNRVVIKWVYPEDDDYMAEIGEEFREDVRKATFELVVTD
ncbi:MAG: DUF1987 domain-containing protein [Pseudomonadales bacterium]|uniref:SiaC family regulatory phosphoprotein domain-containing protein n=1 Tax=Oleiphilus messinensis TaxID=141451 RepID=A0A1Y0IFF9_9GAMM|nr:DUF1987 domain-containing protein [Oleiphilus messinensis]ARU59221.1 hypothetical protein OLMES_5237 [Oleiphilus messinensis]MCG8611638.1 DUF1987 domain-containing protein [Pseudomonadales bacterium]